MYLPWIRHIYVVTNGVFPCWLKETGKIRFVRHDDIFPNRSHLPTYNSEAIETNLHRIPGLSEYFIYANDDFLFAKPLSFDHFFGGTPLVPRDVHNMCNDAHCPVPLSVSCIQGAWQSSTWTLEAASASKCRVRLVSPITRIFQHVRSSTCSTTFQAGVAHHLNYISCTSASGAYPCVRRNSTVRELVSSLMKDSPSFVVINDNFTEDSRGFSHISTRLRAAQDIIWHTASEFEDDAGCIA